MKKQASQKEPSQPKASQEAPKGAGAWFRMTRKGNGWVVECLRVGADGTMKISPIGDWDMRAVVENKLLNACIRAAAD